MGNYLLELVTVCIILMKFRMSRWWSWLLIRFWLRGLFYYF